LIHRSNYCVINLQTNLGTARRQAKQGKPQRSRNFHQPESLGGEPAAAAAADCGCIFSACALSPTTGSIGNYGEKCAKTTNRRLSSLLGLGRRIDQAPLKSAFGSVALKENLRPLERRGGRIF
jgi:hypothetical protein